MNLVDQFQHGPRLWLRVTPHLARRIVHTDQPQLAAHAGPLGRGIYLRHTPPPPEPTAPSPDAAHQSAIGLTGVTEAPAPVVLEYRLDPTTRLLDLGQPDGQVLWHRHLKPYRKRADFAERLHASGHDGVAAHGRICLADPARLEFSRVFSGVAEDPLIAHGAVLDEFALGGLARCTAVTCNALLAAFHKPPISLSEVPENGYGVLQILTRRGLAYRPEQTAIGHPLVQFVPQHRRGEWYLVTPGHALALVEGALVDAEAKGADQRVLQAAMLISRR